MLTRKAAYRALALLLGLAMFAGLGSGVSAGLLRYAKYTDGDITFEQTGMTLSDAHGFLGYWQAHGGLAQFGYPLTQETLEVSPSDGRLYDTQWFERARFEYHPENAGSQYQVLLSLLGRQLARGREKESGFQRVPNSNLPGCLFFPETGHTLCPPFRSYWEQHGGLPLYGYPLSEPFSEKSPTDGKMYTVQYFERNRFEYHPENKGTQYEVLLSLLGTQLGGFPVPNMPQADVPTTLQVPDEFKRDKKWNDQRTLKGPAGMRVSLFGTAPALRMMAVAPNGDLFVSSKIEGNIYVMPDRDGNGIADDSHVFATDISKPHGLAFHNGYLYVAAEAAVYRFPYTPGQLDAQGPGQKIADLPHGASSGLVEGVGHDTRSIVFGPDNKMYVSVGSSCDLCEEADKGRATIMQFNDDGSNGRIYASGLRNAVGIDIDPRTGWLWASVNERNTRGEDFPPDLLSTVRSGGDYGWPYCLGVPLQPDPQYNRPTSFCSAKESAALTLPAHIAPLGIRFYNGGGQLPRAYDYGIFVGVHGSAMAQGETPPLHNPPYGYDVRFVSLRPGKTAQGAQTVISGWLTSETSYWGRPVDVAFGKDGAMYVSDDAAGAVYRVTFSTR